MLAETHTGDEMSELTATKFFSLSLFVCFSRGKHNVLLKKKALFVKCVYVAEAEQHEARADVRAFALELTEGNKCANRIDMNN